MLWCGAIGAVLFLAVALVDGATRDGYNPALHPVSALSLGSRGWVQIGNFIITGVLMLALALGLRRALGRDRAVIWGSGLVCAFGSGLVLSGVFTMDPVHGYPKGSLPGASGTPSWHGSLHDFAGFVVFASLPAAILVLANSRQIAWRSRVWVLYSRASGLAMIALFVAFASVTEAGGAFAGTLQRLAIATGWIWIAVIATCLARSRSQI